jgi:hypothetical protein
MASNYNYLLKPPVVAVREGRATEIGAPADPGRRLGAGRRVLADVPAPSPAIDQPAPEHPVQQARRARESMEGVTQPLRVALLGCGTVGSAVLRRSRSRRATSPRASGRPVEVAGGRRPPSDRHPDVPAQPAHHRTRTGW